jgi:hypothetical protein
MRAIQAFGRCLPHQPTTSARRDERRGRDHFDPCIFLVSARSNASSGIKIEPPTRTDGRKGSLFGGLVDLIDTHPVFMSEVVGPFETRGARDVADAQRQRFRCSS